MIKNTTLRFAATAAALAIGAVPSAASACQGIQFESRLISFHADEQTEVPDGYRQYRVRLSQRSLESAGARDLIRLSVLPHDASVDGSDAASESDAIRWLMLVKPVGTSCDSAAIPAAGDYYVVGRVARNEAGGPTLINGGALFYPRFTSRPAMADLLSETQ